MIGATYTLSIDGTPFDYTAVSGNTMQDVAAALMAKVGDGGGAVLEADTLLEIQAGGLVTLARGSQLYSEADQSRISIKADQLTVLGSIRAGQDYTIVGTPPKVRPGPGSRRPSICAAHRISCLATAVWGRQFAGYRCDQHPGRFRFQRSRFRHEQCQCDDRRCHWRVRCRWRHPGQLRHCCDLGEAGAGGDAAVNLRGDGDVQLRGYVAALDVGSDLNILSRSQVWGPAAWSARRMR